MPHVLCLRAIHPDAIALMKAAPGVTVEVLDPATPEAIETRIAAADAITVRLAKIDAPLIAKGRKLKIVARHGVGYDAVDVPALTARGIPLTITPEANAGSVAEHALMLMLACARRVTGYDQRLRELLAAHTLPADRLFVFDLRYDVRMEVIQELTRIASVEAEEKRKKKKRKK